MSAYQVGGADLNPDRLGRVRVLLLGNSGSGKTSLAHLIASGKPVRHCTPTVGCNTFVKLIEHGAPAGGHGSAQEYFVELWDIGAHERHQELRSVFYKDINGVILIHDLSSKRSAATLHTWAAEVARQGSFSAPLAEEQAASNLGTLPVPYLTIGNRADLMVSGQSAMASAPGWLSQAWARLWGVVPSSFPLHQRPRGSNGNSVGMTRHQSQHSETDAELGLTASAVSGRLDLNAVNAFFGELIERRYFGRDSSRGPPSVGLAPTGVATSPALEQHPRTLYSARRIDD